MTEGFAFVAYPAEYRSSGVMTFIVNEEGSSLTRRISARRLMFIAKNMKEYKLIPVGKG